MAALGMDGFEKISFAALGTLSLTNVYKSIKIVLLYLA